MENGEAYLERDYANIGQANRPNAYMRAAGVKRKSKFDLAGAVRRWWDKRISAERYEPKEKEG